MIHLPRRPISALLRSNLISACSKTLPLRRFIAGAVPLYRRPLIHPPFRPTTDLLKSSRFHSPRPLMLSTSANLQREEVEKAEGFALLKSKLEKEGIDSSDLKPGKEHRLLCPKCGGRSSNERSCSLFVRGDGQFAMWNCFRTKCGQKGVLEASGDCKSSLAAKRIPRRIPKAEGPRAITEDELQLQPLSTELLQYFSVRRISPETLRRNGVRQRLLYNQVFIAFVYRRNGSPISCKYRGTDKKFLQEPGTERIFYGLDDIKHGRDIIIVEGEIDKLAMDEAGYSNCVSVPDGAPAKVSKEVPDEEEDTKFKFLWNCRQYLDKASRIILATDADLRGQALAEEIARRVGKERCWRVTWPENCIDANEVLMYFGRDTLKEVIENAELYPYGDF